MGERLTRRALREDLPAWGVLLLESHHAPAFTMEWRTHPFVKVVYVLRGRGEFLIDRRNVRFSQGDVIVVPPGSRNRIVDDPAAASALYVCCVATSLLEFDRRLVGRFRAGAVHPDGHFSNRVASLMRRMAYAQSRESANRPIAMVTDALRMIRLVTERGKKRSGEAAGSGDTPERQAVAAYVARLRRDFFDATTVDAAAASLGIPRRTFTRLFREQTGESWLRFVRRHAIGHARHRLKTTDLPIISVAFECGFNDLTTFYRQFKSRCGVSPAEYRRSSGKAER